MNFDAVSADTFTYLLEATAAIRSRVSAAGGVVRYAAYGYHGCEVLINGAYTWQSYTPYLPGWAKIRLEEAAIEARAKGITAAVFNCPEIQTNSSALFLGVEISLYPLLAALKKEGNGPRTEAIRAECAALLKEGTTLDTLLAKADEYLASPVMTRFSRYEEWPHHTTPEQAEFMLSRATELLAMNRNPREIVCAVLSRAVFNAVGKLMLDASWNPTAPVFWLNHDIVARRLVTA
jgi:hypothetical protein